MSNPDDATQIPASIIDISNNDMPTMHVPSRDSMYRPDLSSSIDDYIYEEEDDGDDAVEYSENDEIEKKSSGLLAPLSPTSYEFNQAIEGLSIEYDEDSYASEDLISTVSIPDVNETGDETDDETGDETDDEAALDDKSAEFYNDIIKLSVDIRRGTVGVGEINEEETYSVYKYNGVGWTHQKDLSGRDLLHSLAAILFEHPYGVFLKDEPPGHTYGCNPLRPIRDDSKWFEYTYDDGRVVPYYHTVISGDVVSCISKTYKVKMKDIDRINKHIHGSPPWDIDKIEVGFKIYLVPEDVADLVHKSGKYGIFKDKCKGRPTLDVNGESYSEFCDPNSDKFIGPIKEYHYIEYCERGDTLNKEEEGYSELCDPNSEWYSGRKIGEGEDCDDEGRCSPKPGEPADSGESDYRSEAVKYNHDIQAAKREEEELEEKRKKLIAKLKPHPMVKGWREVEAQRMAGINETYSAYGVSLGLRLGREIYEHEVLFWEGPYNVGGNYSYLGKNKSLAEIYPLCYEKQRFETNIIDRENGVYIPAGNYSLRKCVPEENGKRVWDHTSKRLVSYREISAAGVTIDVWRDPRDLPKNETFDNYYDQDPGLDADAGGGDDLSSDSWVSRRSNITIVGPDQKVVTSNYSIARERLLEFAAGSGLKLIMSSGMPDEERCSKDPCDGGWCMPDAMTSFMYTNTSGYDRYNIGYDPQRVDEVGNQTGWNLDPTPWVTEESGPVSIASVFTKQVMPSTDSSGPWQTLTTWGDPKTIDLKEWPHSSSEYSMQLKIVRDNSRDNRLNREQRLLKTLIDLHEESISVNQESIHKYAIYFVHPYEAFNPVLGECNYIRQYYDEYIKLSGDETGVSILHTNRPKNKDGSKDEHHISVAKDLSVESVLFSHRGPKFDFYQVEEFYLKWRALSK